ncbi:MAG: MerR family transcriptional regulator [Alphaproteobacteria bacterium]
MENKTEYFISINDVSKRLDVPAYTLRYWEKQFPTAIKPTTGAGGRRYYRQETVENLIAIKDLLYNQGMTIAGVKKILRNGDFAQYKTGTNNMPDAPLQKNSLQEIDDALSVLYEIKGLLKN